MIAAILLCGEMFQDSLTCIHLEKCVVKYIGTYFNTSEIKREKSIWISFHITQQFDLLTIYR